MNLFNTQFPEGEETSCLSFTFCLWAKARHYNQSFSLSQAKSYAGPDSYPRWSCSTVRAKVPRELSMKLQGFLRQVKGSWRNQHWILVASAEKRHVTLLPVCWPGLVSWHNFKGAKKCYPVHVRERRRTRNAAEHYWFLTSVLFISPKRYILY